jgi:hypothetical protein
MIEKFVRFKHCRDCDVCIHRFDHHCVWIRNCIGENNHRSFFLLLLSEGIGHILFLFLQYKIMRMAEYEYTLSYYALLVLSFSLNLFGMGFSLFMVRTHWSVMLRNATTNEAINWHKYPHFCVDLPPDEIGFKNPFDKSPYTNMKHFWVRSSYPRVYRIDGSWT